MQKEIQFIQCVWQIPSETRMNLNDSGKGAIMEYNDIRYGMGNIFIEYPFYSLRFVDFKQIKCTQKIRMNVNRKISHFLLANQSDEYGISFETFTCALCWRIKISQKPHTQWMVALLVCYCGIDLASKVKRSNCIFGNEIKHTEKPKNREMPKKCTRVRTVYFIITRCIRMQMKHIFSLSLRKHHPQ